MGLDIYCKKEDCKEVSFRAGSYSGFHAWRVTLAKLNGISLDTKLGFDGDIPWTTKEPFYELLNHSDCDGELTQDDCKQLLKDFAENPDLTSDDTIYWREKYVEWFYAIVHSAITGHVIVFG